MGHGRNERFTYAFYFYSEDKVVLFKQNFLIASIYRRIDTNTVILVGEVSVVSWMIRLCPSTTILSRPGAFNRLYHLRTKYYYIHARK